MKRTMAGLTLLELMVALAIVAIAAGLGLPAFGATMERTRAMTIYNGVTTALVFARNAAVTQRRPAAVCPSADGLRCRTDGVWDDGWIVFMDPEHHGQPKDAASVLQRGERLHGQMRLRATAGRPVVRFQRSGSAYGSNVTLRLCKDARLLGTIVLNNAGRARTTRGPATARCPFALD